MLNSTVSDNYQPSRDVDIDNEIDKLARAALRRMRDRPRFGRRVFTEIQDLKLKLRAQRFGMVELDDLLISTSRLALATRWES